MFPERVERKVPVGPWGRGCDPLVKYIPHYPYTAFLPPAPKYGATVSYGPRILGDPESHRGHVHSTKEYTMALTIIGAPKVSELDANMELENLDLEDALEEQVKDYFSDWEVDDLDEAEIGGRIVTC